MAARKASNRAKRKLDKARRSEARAQHNQLHPTICANCGEVYAGKIVPLPALVGRLRYEEIREALRRSPPVDGVVAVMPHRKAVQWVDHQGKRHDAALTDDYDPWKAYDEDGDEIGEGDPEDDPEEFDEELHEPGRPEYAAQLPLRPRF
jgi:hypothetical protein